MTSPILLLCFSGALWICFGASQGASIEASKIQPGEPASYEEGSCQDDLECEEAEVCLEGVCTLQNVDLVQDSPLATHDSQAEKSRLAKESFIEELKEDHESVEEDYEAGVKIHGRGAKIHGDGGEIHGAGGKGHKRGEVRTGSQVLGWGLSGQTGAGVLEVGHGREQGNTVRGGPPSAEQAAKDKKNSALATPQLGVGAGGKYQIGADVVTITRKGSIIDRYVNDQRSVSKDTSNNLIDPDVEFKQDTLIGKFTRRLKNDDVEHDIDLSNPEGIIMFVPGGEVGSDKSYSILPEKINLGQHFAQEEEDEDIPTDESSSTKRDIINFSYEDPPDVDVTTHPSLIETMETLEDPTDNPTAITMDVDVKYIRERDEERHEIQGQEAIASTIQPVPLKNKILPELIPDSEACQEANIGKKLGLSGTPTRYQFCNHNGDPDVGQCPSGSLFYSQLHCCVSTLKFPCLKNCLADI
eukprot:snap_masked-scaffold271_size230452-processed-gene-0.2 protein:Tk11456 transcript:snap_masked-scaffold271_size230452-processed-gene-0.2-mRNA-1 annotation:"domon domain protein"